jgi:hypothetical protein
MRLIEIKINKKDYDSMSLVMKSLDCDLGGELSFGPKFIEDENGQSVQPETYSTSMMCSEECFQLLSDADLLYDYVLEDYLNRWEHLIAPSRDDVELFIEYFNQSNEVL